MKGFNTAMQNTIYDICMSYTDKQQQIIDPFFKETPLFKSMPCIEASKGAINTFEKVKDVAIPEFVNYDSPLPVISASTELGYATIGKIGGSLNLPLDKCRLLGKEKMLASQLPLIFNRTGQAFDYSYMYNSLKAFCLENKSECVTKIHNAGSAFYSMIGVTWSEGENCGLYQPALSGEKMFNITPIAGGEVTRFNDASGNPISGYVLEITMFLGIQLPRTDRIHALVNIDSTHIPTYNQLLDFVYNFGGYTQNSAIYVHPRCLNLILASFTTDATRADMITRGADGILRIAGCPVIVDQNMLNGTEAIVS